MIASISLMLHEIDQDDMDLAEFAVGEGCVGEIEAFLDRMEEIECTSN